jgi:two-component system, sensor histidine kinase
MLPVKVPPTNPYPMTHRNQRVARRESPAAADTHLLIVDGDRQVGRTLSFMLEARGYGEVRAVRSAARAEAIFGVFQPGIVFLDLDLPDDGSLRLAEQLRRHSRLRKFRLIALTHDVQHAMRDDARAAGFERYLVKPVAQAELDKVLFIPATLG